MKVVVASRMLRRWLGGKPAESPAQDDDFPSPKRSFRNPGIGVTFFCLLTHTLMEETASAQATLPTENVAKLEIATVRFCEDVRHDDWATALDRLQQITQAAEPSFATAGTVADPLGKAIVRCFRAVHHRDHPGALHAVNKIRLWATLQAAPVPSNLAQEIAHLGFVARELQVDLEEGNGKKAAASIDVARQCWDRLKPMLRVSGDESRIQEGESLFHNATSADPPETLRQDQATLSTLVEKLEWEFSGGRR